MSRKFEITKTIKRYQTICLLAWLIVSSGCLTEYQPDNNGIERSSLTTASGVAEKGRIVYVSYVDGWNGEIYVMNDDGTEQVQLTDHEANDNDPVWSPDGRKIAFSSDRDDAVHVYVMNADGSNVHRLTNSTDIHEVNPAWSPDGKWIVFGAVSTDGYGTTLQVVNLVSGEIKELVGANYTTPSFPSWSPDSKFVWFSSWKDQITVMRSDLYTVDIDSGEIKRVTNTGVDGGAYQNINVSPDGSRILFSSSPRYPGSQILDIQTLDISNVFELDFSRYEELYPGLINESYKPDWSPDGNALVFSMETEESESNIYRLDFQSQHLTKLTNDPGYEMSADWWQP